MRALSEVAEEHGVSYRQANYWASQGWVRVSWFKGEEELPEPPEEHRGLQARLDPHAQQQFGWLAECVRAGLPPERAAEVSVPLAAGARTVRISDRLVLCPSDRMDVDAVATL